MQQLGRWTLEDGPRIVAWWTADGLGRVVADVSWPEALSTFARVLARYPEPAPRFHNARSLLGRLDADRVLPVALELGHHVALVRPLTPVGAGEGGEHVEAPALVAAEAPLAGLAMPILAGSPAEAAPITRLIAERWPGVRTRVLKGERGVRSIARGAPELAAGQAPTELEDHVVAATAGAPWAAARPVVRRHPQNAWLDDLVAGADAVH